MSLVNIIPGANAQAFIDSSAEGDEIKFKGDYNLRDVTLRPNRKYLADLDATINVRNGYAFRGGGDNITIDGLRFTGPAFGRWDGPPIRALVFNRCAFTMPNQDGSPPAGEQWSVINSNRAFVDSRITNCIFDKVAVWTPVFLYMWRGFLIDHCEFLNINNPANVNSQGRGMKLMGDDGPKGSEYPEGNDNSAILRQTCFGLIVSNNIFWRVAGMNSEQQRGADGTEYYNNVSLEPLFTDNQQSNLDRYAFSLPNARGTNLKFHHNLVSVGRDPGNDPLRKGPERLRQMLEIGGQNVKVWQNAFFGVPGRGRQGVNASIVLDSSNGSAEVYQNLMVDCPDPYADNNARLNAHDNGPGVKLDWDINRPYPKASIHGATGTSVPDPSGAVTPPVVIPEQPLFTPTITVGADNLSATLAWPAQAGQTTYPVQIKTSKGGDAWKTLGNVAGTSTKISGLHSGWEYDFRVGSGNVFSGVLTQRIGSESLATRNVPNAPFIGDEVVTPDNPPPLEVADPVIKVEPVSGWRVTHKSGKVETVQQ
jgi:hypothetical protein